MRAGEREGRVVIEGGRCPVGRRVAQCAIGWEAGGDVGRVGGAGEVLLVAAVATGGQRGVVVIDVA